MADIDIWLPRKLAFLREPNRYKVLISPMVVVVASSPWSIAQSLLIAGGNRWCLAL